MIPVSGSFPAPVRAGNRLNSHGIRSEKPGFGAAEAGGAGSRAVLEVRSHDVPFILEDGQIVGRLVYEKMAELPRMLYGASLSSNYQAQGLKLSKHFRNPA